MHWPLDGGGGKDLPVQIIIYENKVQIKKISSNKNNLEKQKKNIIKFLGSFVGSCAIVSLKVWIVPGHWPKQRP